MTLAEQLQELRFNILRDHSNQTGGVSDELWSDETLIRYIKDGENRFARQALCLRDSTTPECCQIKLQLGVTSYKLHSSVLAVLSSRFDTDNFDIQRSGHSLILQYTPAEFFSFDPTVGWTPQPGHPIAFYTDETLVFARQNSVTYTVYPAPSALEDGKIMYLRVIRRPLTTYDLNSMDRQSDIPEDYQLDCLEWAAYRAQRQFDADSGAIIPSDRHKAAFDAAVLDARKELKRTMFANVTMGYGQLGTNYTR